MSFTQRREIFIKVQEAEKPKEEAQRVPEQLSFDFVCLGRHIFILGDADNQLRCVRCGTEL